jgi:c-di-GMP-binding flagellar brake protein YcgR
MILLQYGPELISGLGNPRTYLYFGIGIVGLVALIVIGTLVSRRAGSRAPTDPTRFSNASFRRTGKAIGLTPAHIDMLENLVRVCKLKQPFLLFTSTTLLDDTLKKGLHSIDNARDLAEDERENRRAIVFQIKQIVEQSGRKGAQLSSTTSLKPGQMLTITPEGAGPFSSKVISNMKDFLTVGAPTQPAGADTRWMRGTKLSVYLWKENDAGYSFQSKVLGYDTVKGIPSVLIQHSKTLRREQRRRSRRRELMRPCFYFPIRIVESGEGRRAERKAVVDQSLRTLGTVVDLSAGGCAIQTLNPIDKGKLVMIEFDIDRTAPIRAYGKVAHIHRQRGRGGVMHVMFTRVTRQYLNRITEFVYDFSRPTTTAQVRQQADRANPGRGDMRPLSR